MVFVLHEGIIHLSACLKIRESNSMDCAGLCPGCFANWSMDGKKIIFARTMQGEGNLILYRTVSNPWTLV